MKFIVVEKGFCVKPEITRLAFHIEHPNGSYGRYLASLPRIICSPEHGVGEEIGARAQWQQRLPGKDFWENCDKETYELLTEDYRRQVLVENEEKKTINMKNIPTQNENPRGLHGRYFIQKIVPHPQAGQEIPVPAGIYDKRDRGCYPDYELKSVDKDAHYFVLRLDEGGKDPEHIKACRIAIKAYADAIEHHLPELAKDLRERYPPL